LKGFRILTTDPAKPTCEAISNCKISVDDKNLNLNGRCLECNANFSLKASYDISKPA
jgi:hypothetical protein